MAKYRAKRKSYVVDQLVERGEVFEYDGIPSQHWEPLDETATKRVKEVKDRLKPGAARAREENRDKSAFDADPIRTSAAGGNPGTGPSGYGANTPDPVADVPTDDLNDDNGDQAVPEPQDEAARKSFISKALAELNHEDDAHWTQDGKPDLNVIKEKLGFAVKRGEMQEYFPEFIRQK